MSPTRARAAVLDEICAEATDLARAAAEELAGAANVGDHVGVYADDERVVTHLFSNTDRAYVGWRWAVTVSRASRAKTVTVSEAVLLPGPDSLMAPDWVPWSERVRPGDLGVGDLMPAATDDERLVPVSMLEGDDGVLDWDDSASWDQGRELAASLGISGGAAEAPGISPAGASVASAGPRRLEKARKPPPADARLAGGPGSCPLSAGTRQRSGGTPASTGQARRSPAPHPVLVPRAAS